MKKILLPLLTSLILFCACTNHSGTENKQPPLASTDLPSTEAISEIAVPKSDSEAINTTPEKATETSTQETPLPTETTTSLTTVPTTVSTTESTTASTTATTVAHVTNTSASESAAPSETGSLQTEWDIGVDTADAIVYESGNDLIVSREDSIMMIPGAVKHIAEQFTDYFVYDRIYYINVSKDPTWNTYEYIAGEELMEITNISDNRKLSQLSDGTSSMLALGTKIYECENQRDMLLALVDGELVPYYAMVEG